MRRVLTSPGRGALANTAIWQSLALVTIKQCQIRRIGAEEIGSAQSPHQQHRSQHAVLLPAAAGGDYFVPKTNRTTELLKRAAYGDVFHQRNLWEAAYCIECGASNEDTLIASRDPRKPRAPVHQACNQAEHWIRAGDNYIESTPYSLGRN